MTEKYITAMYFFVFFKPSFIGFQFSSSLQCLQPWYLELESSSKAPPSERRSELNIRQFVSFITFLLRSRMQVKKHPLVRFLGSIIGRLFNWKSVMCMVLVAERQKSSCFHSQRHKTPTRMVII